MTSLFLQAVDVWMFRDGKPFDVGGGYRAESIFPPFPSTIQGAIRSHELVLAGVDVKDQAAIEEHVGTDTDMYGRKIKGTFVAEYKEGQLTAYLPVPANAAAEEGKGWKCLKPIPPLPGIQTSSSLPQVLWPNLDPGKHHGFGDWLSLDEWKNFWGGQSVIGKTSRDLFMREARFGIEINYDRRTVEESQLYETEFIRPQTYTGLLVETEGFTHAKWKSGFLRLGGEGHGATYESVTDFKWPATPNPLPKQFALCFITPTYFAGGWQPTNGDWSKFFDGPVKLLSAAFGHYQSLGGFDWAKFRRNPQGAQAHKPARRYLPAGAMYFFENQGATALRANTITDDGADFGFGRVLIH